MALVATYVPLEVKACAVRAGPDSSSHSLPGAPIMSIR
jgi:hypothetical protein